MYQSIRFRRSLYLFCSNRLLSFVHSLYNTISIKFSHWNHSQLRRLKRMEILFISLRWSTILTPTKDRFAPLTDFHGCKVIERMDSVFSFTLGVSVWPNCSCCYIITLLHIEAQLRSKIRWTLALPWHHPELFLVAPRFCTSKLLWSMLACVLFLYFF